MEEVLGAIYGYSAGAVISTLIDAAFGDPEEQHKSFLDLVLNLGMELALLGALAFPVIEVLSEVLETSEVTQTTANMFFIVGMQPGLQHLDSHTRQIMKFIMGTSTLGSKEITENK